MEGDSERYTWDFMSARLYNSLNRRMTGPKLRSDKAETYLLTNSTWCVPFEECHIVTASSWKRAFDEGAKLTFHVDGLSCNSRRIMLPCGAKYVSRQDTSHPWDGE